MQDQSGKIAEQRNLLFEGSFGPNIFTNILELSNAVVELGASKGFARDKVRIPCTQEELDGGDISKEIRILRIFEGLKLELPTTREELSVALDTATDYYAELAKNPEQIHESVGIHDLCCKYLEVNEDFPLEHFFLLDTGADFGITDTTFPFAIAIDKELFDFSDDSLKYERINTVIHEFIHRYRMQRSLVPINGDDSGARFKEIEDGLAALIAGKICEKEGLMQGIKYKSIYFIESTVIGNLLDGMSLQDIANITMEELESKAGLPLQELEDFLNNYPEQSKLLTANDL